LAHNNYKSLRLTSLLAGTYLGGTLRLGPSPFGGENIVLILNMKICMLNFEHFSKRTPEIYPLCISVFRRLKLKLKLRQRK